MSSAQRVLPRLSQALLQHCDVSILQPASQAIAPAENPRFEAGRAGQVDRVALLGGFDGAIAADWSGADSIAADAPGARAARQHTERLRVPCKDRSASPYQGARSVPWGTCPHCMSPTDPHIRARPAQ